ncbi:hypothetical protein DFP72DRAFT_1060134 [Ephemerocybe angulata]|uniref:Uncharacterized protein n=1 Tax=Ephemerocybe angulata TaxID=980116 RepID=A0A8H6MBC8_9AGAR|nr:hypothetical protein DFP72DRAFT_1060134 [Tulosesus angulatus]
MQCMPISSRVPGSPSLESRTGNRENTRASALPGLSFGEIDTSDDDDGSCRVIKPLVLQPTTVINKLASPLLSPTSLDPHGGNDIEIKEEETKVIIPVAGASSNKVIDVDAMDEDDDNIVMATREGTHTPPPSYSQPMIKNPTPATPTATLQNAAILQKFQTRRIDQNICLVNDWEAATDLQTRLYNQELAPVPARNAPVPAGYPNPQCFTFVTKAFMPKAHRNRKNCAMLWNSHNMKHSCHVTRFDQITIKVLNKILKIPHNVALFVDSDFKNVTDQGINLGPMEGLPVGS